MVTYPLRIVAKKAGSHGQVGTIEPVVLRETSRQAAVRPQRSPDSTLPTGSGDHGEDRASGDWGEAAAAGHGERAGTDDLVHPN
jgi:hypothetical protein